MSSKILTGFEDGHIYRDNDENILLQKVVLDKFYELKTLASEYGIDLQVISSYRSFSKQLTIWNEKALGKRTLLDRVGSPLEYSKLTKYEVLHSILRWSAIPGMSRHHWGSDLDVVDNTPLLKNPNYKIQLTPQEYQIDGIFSKLGNFLKSDALLKCGFFRPYDLDLGGVSPEPWHLSFAAIASEQEKLLSLDLFNEWLNSTHVANMELIELLREDAPAIFKTYVTNTQSNPMA